MISKRTRNARLRKLAGLLEADAANKEGIKFHLCGGWGTVQDEAAPLSCGTTACAVGLAAISGAFKRQGLGCNIGPHEIEIRVKGKLVKDRTGERNPNFMAARKFFGLTDTETSFLFISGRNLPQTTGALGELAVAARIRDFVAGKAKP